ncbi:hypothetical protein JOF53_005099 [Crossiella equi]|uniref:Uncharacterized protein n=2 Tax=Crossiella equi TaxID=130796 RepID=A0ABS5AI26_9PSEU|nr:hypothetical protein [Crossiella equi]MBP2476227.1 hypothetical protein [Crossiella equi]
MARVRGPGFEWRGLWGALAVLAGVGAMLVLPLLASVRLATPVVPVRTGEVVTLRGEEGGATVDLTALAGWTRPASHAPDAVSAVQGRASVSIELKTGVIDPRVTFNRISRLYALQDRPVTPSGEFRTDTGTPGIDGGYRTPAGTGVLVLLGGPGAVVTVSAENLPPVELRRLLDGVVIGR